MEEVNQRTVSLTDLDRFPPTVVDHTKYADGYDLYLLDEGRQETPRFIRTYFDDRPMERHL